MVIPSLLFTCVWGRGVPTEVEPHTGSALHLESAKYSGDDGFPRLVKAARKPFVQDHVLGSCHMGQQRLRGQMGLLVPVETAGKYGTFVESYCQRQSWLENA